MNADKEIVALLRDIRDLVQVIAMKVGMDIAPEDAPPASERNSRSWSLSAHRTHPNNSDKTASE